MPAGILQQFAKRRPNATRIAAPQAAIVHDLFHVSKHLNESVDQSRRQEAAKLAEKGDETLKQTRYPWLHGIVKEKHQASCAELLEMNLKTSRAWLYKEQMLEFWRQPDTASGERFFSQWYRTVKRSRLPKVMAVARTLKSHLVNLLTHFQHPITNALTEGFNSKIQAIKADARGFRRFENYRARILFFLWQDRPRAPSSLRRYPHDSVKNHAKAVLFSIYPLHLYTIRIESAALRFRILLVA
ncbi:MAG: transposase [Opitutaceae bacterium]|nr:transposase [Opitutaceae bacterium]